MQQDKQHKPFPLSYLSKWSINSHTGKKKKKGKEGASSSNTDDWKCKLVDACGAISVCVLSTCISSRLFTWDSIWRGS